MNKKIVLLLTVLFLASALNASIVWVKAGLYYPECNSDLWKVNFDNLILQKADFQTSQFFFEWESAVSPILSVGFQFGSMQKTEVDTEYRDYTYNDGSSIGQAVSYKVYPYELTFKIYPIKKRHMVFPYVGVGLGFYSVTYKQWGDFINFDHGATYEGDFLSKTTNLGGSGFVGIVIRPTKSIMVGVEGKYQYLKSSLSSEFEGFEPLDLSGVSLSFMLGVMF
jgi:outer membrane protein W